MSEKINDGGPAWPVPCETAGYWADPATCKLWVQYTGMSLRDYFAGQALAGLLANPTWASDCARHGFPATEGAAISAYEHADAMLRARGDK